MSYKGRMFDYRRTGSCRFEVYETATNSLFYTLEYDKETGIFTDDDSGDEYTASELRREMQRAAKWTISEYPDIDFNYENGEEGGIVKSMIFDAENEGREAIDR